MKEASLALDCRKIHDFGIGSYVRGLLQGFAELRLPERLILVGGGETSARLAQARPGWRYVSQGSRPYSVSEQVTLPRIAAHLHVDLWHFPHYVTPLVLREPMVVTVHDLIHLERPGDRNMLAYPYALLFLTRALERARIVITGTEAVKRRLQALVPGCAPRVRVIPHGVDQQLLEEAPPMEREEAVALVGAPRPLILYVGNDLPHKNLVGLVEAAARARDLLEPAGSLVLVGPVDDETSPWARRARDLGIAHLVKALGTVPIEILRALYAEATLLVHPSLAEGFGLPPLEAMAQGAPVLAARLDVLVEVLGDHASYYEPSSLGSALCERLVGSEESLSREERRRFAASFTWRRAAESVRSAYEEAMGQE